MKLKIFALAGAITMFTACNKDGLDLANPNQLTTSSFWKTQDDAMKATVACYAGLQEEGVWKRWMYIDYISRSDEGNSFSPWGDFSNYSKFTMPDYNFGPSAETWQDHYKTIFRTNQVIAYIPDITMDENLKKRSIAEAKFIRAILYFELTTLYAKVPIVLSPSATTDRPPYATPDKVFEQVIKDLTEAKPDLPVSYNDSDKGRITKGAAAALLGKVYMQQHNWAAAAPQLLEVINGPYALVPDYMDNFRMSSENNVESIFEIQFSDQFNGAFWDKDSPSASEGSRRAIYFAPRQVGGYSDATATQWCLDQLKMEKTIDGKNDPRLDATFIYKKAPGEGGTTKYWGLTYDQLMPSAPFDFWFRKYDDDETTTQVTENSGNNYRIIRLADVLLLYAECLNELNQTQDAYQYIDKVRQRVHLAKLSDAKPGLTQQQMRDQLDHERVTELASEGQRWYDLLRWGKLTTQAGVDEMKVHDAEFNFFKLNKNDVLPIPQRELDINPNLQQNPNY